MRDFSAILRNAALEAVKIAGPNGPSGPAQQNTNNFNAVTVTRSGTTYKVELVPVVPEVGSSDENGTTGTSDVERVVPQDRIEKHKLHQRVGKFGTTGTIGTTQNNEGLNKSDPAAIRRAALRNSIDLFELQTDTMHCLVCHEREDRDRPFVPVCTASPGRHHWIHLQCHGAHIDQVNARVDVAFANAPPF